MTHRLWYACLSLGCTLGTTYVCSDLFLYWYVQDATRPFLCTTMTEAFVVYLQITAYVSLYLWLPYVLYTGWAFCASSLFTHEKAKWTGCMTQIIVLVVFSYGGASVYMIPLITQFFFTYGHGEGLVVLDMDPRLASYVSMCASLYMAAHCCVLLPFLVWRTGLPLRRRWVYLGTLCAVAAWCPPDLGLQALCTGGAIACVEALLCAASIAHAYHLPKTTVALCADK